MGNGFSCLYWIKRILLKITYFFVDLVYFFITVYCSFVIIEIKTHKLTYQDVGHQMYVKYYDRMERLSTKTQTWLAFHSTDKNDATVVKFSLPEILQVVYENMKNPILPTENN
jgi:hypothetical protein